MGSVVISIDAELGWGFHDFERPPEGRLEAGRRGWNRLLALLERHEVPATWAIVGHLQLPSCDGHHPDHPAGPDWFARERGDWADREDLRCAPDLVQTIIDNPVEHEIGSHTFSHVLFQGATDRETATYELERCQELAQEWGLSLESFVFPRNIVGHRRVLADAGIHAYRGVSPTPDGARGIVDATIRNRSLLVTPTVDEYGMVNIPASTFLFGFEGRARRLVESVWEDPMVVQTKRGIDAATVSDGVFHLWLHPNNLVDQRCDERLEAVLAYIDECRRERELRVETMGEVADRVTNPGSPAVTNATESRHGEETDLAPAASRSVDE